MGPLLFLIYVNDMPEVCLNSEFMLYADDTVLTIANNNIVDLFNNMQLDVFKIKEWCDVNKLTINVKKTKLMCFNVKPIQYSNCPVISLNQEEIEIVTQYKYLGITIDHELNMYDHIDYMYRMASDKLYLLRHVRKFLTESAAILIMKTMILPYLDMGNCFLTGVKVKETNRLETLLNASIRVAYCINRPVDITRYDLHCRAKILPLHYRRTYFLLTTVYRLIQTNCIPLKPVIRDTRHNAGPIINFEIPHTTRCQKLPFYYAATQWNSLPSETRLSPTMNNFKNIVRTKLFEQYNIDNANIR